jgi:diguanylate cyclase (GGDEF)-like protein
MLQVFLPLLIDLKPTNVWSRIVERQILIDSIEGPIKVLVVDDDEMILLLYQDILSHQALTISSESDKYGRDAEGFETGGSRRRQKPDQHCFELTLCDNGTDAVAAIRAANLENQLFSMAFVDIRMPGHDGIWTAENIRALSPNTQIVMVTGFNDVDPFEIEKRIPPPDRLLYIQKPFHPYEIRQFASTLAARWKAEKKMQALNQNLEVLVEKRTAELQKAYKKLEYQATHDPLTELLNRRAIFDTLKREISRTRRTDKPITVILADIDHFKTINDTYGHKTGDVVLVATAKILLECVRPYDSVGRIGGEEFLIVLPECDTSGGITVADRIRSAVGDQKILISDKTHTITISLGVATIPAHQPVDQDMLISAADQALYRAKRKGRNQVQANPEFRTA